MLTISTKRREEKHQMASPAIALEPRRDEELVPLRIVKRLPYKSDTPSRVLSAAVQKVKAARRVQLSSNHANG